MVKTAASAQTGVHRVERELMYLTRALEALQRKRAYPLDRAQFIILRTLSEAGPQTVGGIAKALLLDDSTMTRQIAALVAKKLVVRTPGPTDKRVGLVAATARGEALMREMLAARRERVDRYVGGWSASERATFGRLLGRLNTALVEALGE